MAELNISRPFLLLQKAIDPKHWPREWTIVGRFATIAERDRMAERRQRRADGEKYIFKFSDLTKLSHKNPVNNWRAD